MAIHSLSRQRNTSRPPRGGRGLKYYAGQPKARLRRSPPSRGAWIEITTKKPTASSATCRPPRGGRGLKYHLPAYRETPGGGRPPRGGRGLKSLLSPGKQAGAGRPPRGGRGLKFVRVHLHHPHNGRPLVGAWIERCLFTKVGSSIITACQCFWYFNHGKVIPKSFDMPNANGRILILYVAWLPFEDKIADASFDHSTALKTFIPDVQFGRD